MHKQRNTRWPQLTVSCIHNDTKINKTVALPSLEVLLVSSKALCLLDKVDAPSLKLFALPCIIQPKLDHVAGFFQRSQLTDVTVSLTGVLFYASLLSLAGILSSRTRLHLNVSVHKNEGEEDQDRLQPYLVDFSSVTQLTCANLDWITPELEPSSQGSPIQILVANTNRNAERQAELLELGYRYDVRWHPQAELDSLLRPSIPRLTIELDFWETSNEY